MTEVYVIGGFVAFTRLEELGRVSIGIGGWAVAATALLTFLVDRVLDRRHVWKTSPSADHHTMVTSGTGIETAPVVASDNRTILVLHSDARVPMRPALAGKGELRDLASEALPSDFPSSALVTPQQVIL